MKLKEHIYHSIQNMDSEELMIIYEQIHLLEQRKHSPSPTAQTPSLETILEMTDSSSSCWADTVSEERG
ncbi:hypothetical protein GF339_18330 [candidate division KSB3 bacterium]|uniref:DUF2281 domain-containing protein n=1 Tax=candidate division KSB3 bacterium TaxID=2044937 RepID=A0A9D5Q7K8_9BACT|nr:hypothetical protein [candidate division KSB3 bacterium]